MLNISDMEGKITYSVKKRLKSVKKMSFVILNYFSKSRLLTSTFTSPVDYQKQKKLLQGSFFYIWMYKSGSKTLAVFG